MERAPSPAADTEPQVVPAALETLPSYAIQGYSTIMYIFASIGMGGGGFVLAGADKLIAHNPSGLETIITSGAGVVLGAITGWSLGMLVVAEDFADRNGFTIPETTPTDENS